MIRIDAVWLSVEPLDMRAGTETALARVIKVFGEARAHHAYLFANRRAHNQMPIPSCTSTFIRLARRLHQGSFTWAESHSGTRLELTHEQLRALTIGLPWHRIGEGATIRVL